MAEFPAMTLWTDRYLADTRHLNRAQHGSYLILLMEAWRRPRCSLPADDAFLAQLAGCSPAEWEADKATILRFWTLDKRRREWTQKGQQKERDFVIAQRAKQADRARKRWNKEEKSDAAALPGKSCGNAPTPTPTVVERETSSLSTPRKRAAPKTRIPPDALISERMRAAATGRGLSDAEAEAQFAKFRDWAVAKGQAYADWDAAWRNWLTSPYFAPAVGAVHPFPSKRQNDVERRDDLHDALKARLAVQRLE